MYLRKILVTADHEMAERYPPRLVGRFGDESACITEHFERLIRRKVVTKDSTAVGFTFTDAIDAPPKAYGVLNCRWPFAFADYVNKSAVDKKRQTLDALYAALQWLSKRERWNRAPLTVAYKEILRKNLAFDGISKRAWLSPDRRFRVRIHFSFDLDQIRYTAILFAARGPKELARKPIGTVGARYDGLATAAEGEWISSTAFCVKSSPRLFARFRWTVDFAEVMER